MGWKAEVGCGFVKERNQEIKVSGSGVGQGRQQGAISWGAAIQMLVGGHGKGLDCGHQAQTLEKKGVGERIVHRGRWC